MDETPNLRLPTIAPNQALKHITHNEALRQLDALVQLSVLDRDLTAPPVGPVDGARYLIPASPTGAWAGKAGKIAAWQDGAWNFFTALSGWRTYVVDEGLLLVFNGTTWVAVAPSLNPAAMVGINTSADMTNRLAVASAASLFNHAGNGHQLKLNKAASGDTASMLYQTNWSGRAEFGLTGDDKFHVKMSPDGSSWAEALVADGAGNVGVGTASPAHKLAVNGVVAPASDNAFTLGASGKRWSAVWSATGTIQTSDIRDKRVDRPIGSEALALLAAISPVFFTWKSAEPNILTGPGENGPDSGQSAGNRDISGPGPVETGAEHASLPGGARLQAGFLAQDVAAALALTQADFAAWGLEDETNPQSRQWLRPDQLLAVLWAATKQIRAEFESLKAQLDS